MDKTTPKEIHIDGWTYNITDFVKKHPGGKVITYYQGMDATDVFHALHARSQKAPKWLETLPRRKIDKQSLDDASDPLIADFRKLREELIKEGRFEPIWSVQIVRMLEALFLYFMVFYLIRQGYWLVGSVVYGFYIGRNGLLMHDMGHRAFTGDVKKDYWWQWFIFALCLSGSSTFWCNQHNKHHAATQEIKHDTDLDTLPAVAFNYVTAKQGHPSVMKWQWLTFIPSQSLLFFLWKFTHTRYAIRTKNYPELIAHFIHHVIEIYLMWDQGIGAMMTYVGVGWAIGGIYLATIFSLNHTHKPVVAAFTRRDWVRRAAYYTTNLTHSFLVSWFVGYLNYQIEHHLFPSIPHPQLPYISSRVQRLFEKHSIPYDMQDFPTAFKLTINNLYIVGNKKEA